MVEEVALLPLVPTDCLARVVEHLEGVGSLRLACRALRAGTDASLRRWRPSRAPSEPLEQLGALLARLTALQELDLVGCTPGVLETCGATYAEFQARAAALAQHLAASSLTALSLSTLDVAHLGSLVWAHNLAAASLPAPETAGKRAWPDGPRAALAADPSRSLLWVPDWLACPPGLRRLVIRPPAPAQSASGGGGSGFADNVDDLCGAAPRAPACLWISPERWQGLRSLELLGVPLLDELPPAIPGGLRQLSSLSLVGCWLEPEALLQLSRSGSGSAAGLRELCVRHNGLLLLPEDWGGLRGLKALDLSHNQLARLPPGLGALSGLTALRLQHNQLTRLEPAALLGLQQLELLDASHNWLAGAQGLAPLLAAWPRLRALRLQNVSDKRGALRLPAGLAGCARLRELAVGHNFALDWQALADVLPHCQALRLLDLEGTRPHQAPLLMRLVLGSLEPRVAVRGVA